MKSRETKSIAQNLSKEATVLKTLTSISKKIENSIKLQHFITLSCIAKSNLLSICTGAQNLTEVREHYGLVLNNILLDNTKQEIVEFLVSLCKVLEVSYAIFCNFRHILLR